MRYEWKSEGIELQRTLVLSTMLFTGFFAPTAQAQINDTCRSVPIVRQPNPSDMTKQLNDDLECLSNKIDRLTAEIIELKRNVVSSKGDEKQINTSNKYEKSENNSAKSQGIIIDGLALSPQGAFLSDDKKTIYADIEIKNENEDNILLMIVGVESLFNMHGVINRSSIIVDGVKDCTPHGGNAASTWLCLGDADIRWSNIERDRVYSVRLSSEIGKLITANVANINIHLLIKKSGKAEAFDAPLNNVEIK